ncbi:MAG: cell division protein FtsZ [Candidatus Methanoplasma sp.]|nr:cell division protein FtsZ [Candidatus Methanoplasma sp.]
MVDTIMEPRIAVVGVGGAGCNVTSQFYESLCNVDTIAINTDKMAMETVSADKKIYICKSVTKGEGTKGDKGLGRKCADAHKEEIEKAMMGHDVVIIIAGLGGGTGTGAASVVADICNRLDIMTFTIVINPFSFESSRLVTAREGLRTIRSVCPGTFVVENDKILSVMPDATMERALRAVNDSIMDFALRMIEGIPGKVMEETESMVKVSVANGKKVSEEAPIHGYHEIEI